MSPALACRDARRKGVNCMVHKVEVKLTTTYDDGATWSPIESWSFEVNEDELRKLALFADALPVAARAHEEAQAELNAYYASESA